MRSSATNTHTHTHTHTHTLQLYYMYYLFPTRFHPRSITYTEFMHVCEPGPSPIPDDQIPIQISHIYCATIAFSTGMCALKDTCIPNNKVGVGCVVPITSYSGCWVKTTQHWSKQCKLLKGLKMA